MFEHYVPPHCVEHHLPHHLPLLELVIPGLYVALHDVGGTYVLPTIPRRVVRALRSDQKGDEQMDEQAEEPTYELANSIAT